MLPVLGTFIGSSKGFGFVSTPGADDIFIPPHFVNGALHGDEVEVKPEADSKLRKVTDNEHPKQLGRIIQIIKRGVYVGTYFTEGTQGYVKPLETKIPYIFSVPPKSKNRFGLGDGHRVVFSVDKRYKPENDLTLVFITDVLGHKNDPGVDVLTLVKQAGIPYEWPPEVTQAAAEVPTEINDYATNDMRLDLRHLCVCTIDGEDTKDIDDAISLSMTDEGLFLLGVHIADVTHYVSENSPIDVEALRRGTSVYLADRVIPMLPHSLSSGICSLFPNVDRLALSCLMTVDEKGHVLDYKIEKTIINSKRRFSYNEVETLLTVMDELNVMDENSRTPDEWLPVFQNLNRLRDILYKKRHVRGALDFDIPEAKIRVDENGAPVSIEPYPRNHATGIIEECMILCNETIAQHCLKQKIPFVYRTHEPPNAIKLTQLNQTASNYGIKIPPLAANPKVLQKILTTIAKTPAAYAVSNAVLRALPQAHYTTDNPKHYGLASEAYCHFTSPIRRYADLKAHRILKNFLQGNGKAALPVSHFKQILPAVCTQASRTEREAEALERDVTQLKKVQFMQGYEGETFTGFVSGITPWGVYIMLPSTIEGMVPVESIKKSGLRYEKDRNCYVSKRNHPALVLGTEVTVRLVSTDLDERKITFRLSDQ